MITAEQAVRLCWAIPNLQWPLQSLTMSSPSDSWAKVAIQENDSRYDDRVLNQLLRPKRRTLYVHDGAVAN